LRLRWTVQFHTGTLPAPKREGIRHEQDHTDI